MSHSAEHELAEFREVVEATSPERVREVIDLDNDEDNQDGQATKRARHDTAESTKVTPSGATTNHCAVWTYQVTRASEAAWLICGARLGPNPISETTEQFLHWLYENPELLDPSHPTLDAEDVTPDDLKGVMSEKNKELAEAYLNHLTDTNSWTEECARNCLRACELIHPWDRWGLMTVQKQSLVLFLLEHRFYAHIVLHNDTELSADLKRLAEISSGSEKPSDVTGLPESVVKEMLEKNQTAAQNLMMHVAEDLYSEKLFKLAHDAFYHANNLERMKDCVTQQLDRAANNKCCICYKNPVDMAFNKCKHAAICQSCYHKLPERATIVADDGTERQVPVCPLCNVPIDYGVRLHITAVSME